MLCIHMEAKPSLRDLPARVARGWFSGSTALTLTPVLPLTGREYEGYQPLWFLQRRDSITGETNFVYKGGYWEAKDKQDWSMCPDIF